MNVRYSITPKTGERLTNTCMSVNGLQTGITKAVLERKLLPDTERVVKCLSGMKGNFHVPFLDEEGRVIASSLVYTGRVVTRDKRKRTVTLRPKGTKSDYNGCRDVIGNGQMVSGSQVASKVFTIICDVERGNGLPEAIHR